MIFKNKYWNIQISRLLMERLRLMEDESLRRLIASLPDSQATPASRATTTHAQTEALPAIS